MDEWRQMDERLKLTVLSAFQKTVGSNIYMAEKTFSCLYKSCQRFMHWIKRGYDSKNFFICLYKLCISQIQACPPGQTFARGRGI